MDYHEIRQLYNRAAFGVLPKELNSFSGVNRTHVVRELFKNSEKVDLLTIPTPEIDAYMAKLPQGKNPSIMSS